MGQTYGENDEWRMANGEWRMASDEWGQSYSYFSKVSQFKDSLKAVSPLFN
jgi:hypothetical protein